MKRYRVRLAADAEQDLIDLYRYIATQDTVAQADYVLDQLEALCSTLTEFPMRGHLPPELERVGVTHYREVHFKPYRVLYEVLGRDVIVHGVLDGRRALQSLLERRLVRGL